MPRQGISYVDVAKSATKLLAQNIHPTIEEVRKDLRTGSNSTINRHLRQWRETQGSQLEVEKGLPETLLIAVKGIYEAMQTDATHKITVIETETKQQLNDSKTQLNQLTHQHNILLQNITALETKIDECQIKELEAQKIINELKQNTDKVNAENQLLQERLQDRKADVERLTQQLKHAQHNLEHYRDSIKQERDSEKHNYQSQINKLEQQLHQHQMNATTLQNKISRSSQHIELLESEKQSIKAELEQTLKNCHDYELLAQRHEINNGNLVINNDRINTAHNALADELKTGKNIISGLKLQLVQSEERALILEHSLKKAEDKISLMSDRHIFLLQEKTELASQLKQILSVSSNKIARGSAYGQTTVLAGQ